MPIAFASSNCQFLQVGLGSWSIYMHLEVGLAHGQIPNLVECQFGKMPGTVYMHLQLLQAWLGCSDILADF